MKAKELIRLLQTLPEDIELVVGDSACGQFWNPVINERQALTGWAVTECWAERNLKQVNFYALLPQAQYYANESQSEVSGPTQCRMLCL